MKAAIMKFLGYGVKIQSVLPASPKSGLDKFQCVAIFPLGMISHRVSSYEAELRRCVGDQF
jgi:hypothetical protein